MKRTCLFLTIVMMLAAIGSAQADIFFMVGDGPMLHRDPLCDNIDIGDLTSALNTAKYASFDALNASEEGYLTCPDCSDYAFSASAQEPQGYYYNPNGGTKLHRDPNCASVSAKHLPLSGTMTPEEAAQSGWTYCQFCKEYVPPQEPAQLYYYNPNGGTYLHHDPNCPTISQKYLPLSGIMTAEEAAQSGRPVCHQCEGHTSDSDIGITTFFQTIEVKAALLPNVWTLPSADAITPDAADRIGKDYVRAHLDRFPQLADGLFTIGILHYDHTTFGGKSCGETYKLLITTTLCEPVGLLAINALTGEVLGCMI